MSLNSSSNHRYVQYSLHTYMHIGAKVKNCILMQGTVVEAGADIEYLVTDKNVTIYSLAMFNLLLHFLNIAFRQFIVHGHYSFKNTKSDRIMAIPRMRAVSVT